MSIASLDIVARLEVLLDCGIVDIVKGLDNAGDLGRKLESGLRDAVTEIERLRNAHPEPDPIPGWHVDSEMIRKVLSGELLV